MGHPADTPYRRPGQLELHSCPPTCLPISAHPIQTKASLHFTNLQLPLPVYHSHTPKATHKLTQGLDGARQQRGVLACAHSEAVGACNGLINLC